MADNLKSKTVVGVVWSTFQKGGSALIGFVSSLVLARLLMPSDYGLIGMLAIFIVVSQTFIDGGLGSALIQKKRPTKEDYSTFFIWNFLLSVGCYLVLFFCAPLIARFYKQEILCSVLRIEGIILIINAISLVQVNQLKKQLNFKKIASIELSVSIISLAICIFLAWKGYGVWALVVQYIVGSSMKTLLFWVTTKWRPILVFSKQSFSELWNFGGFVLLSNLINNFCNNLQGLLIGRLYNPATMGYYSKASHTESLSSSFIASVIEQVAYPVLAEAQNDKTYLIRMMKKFIGVLAYLTIPLLLLLMLLAKPVFVLLYSERWLPSVPYFQIFCIAGIAISLQGINYYAVAAIGKSKDMFKWTLIKRAAGLCFVVGGLFFGGMKGLLAGVVMTAYMIYFVNAGLASKHIGYKSWQQFKDLLPVLLIAFFAFFCAFLLGKILDLNMYINGGLQILLFCLVYIGLSILFKLEAFTSTKEVVFELLSRIRKKE